MVNRYTADKRTAPTTPTPRAAPVASARLRRGRLRETRPRGLPCLHHRPRRHRGVAPPHRPLRLLVDRVRRSVLLDARADLLVYGNAERAIIEIAHRLAARTPVGEISDVRGTAFLRRSVPDGWTEIDSTTLESSGSHHRARQPVPAAARPRRARAAGDTAAGARAVAERRAATVYEQVHDTASCTRTRRASFTSRRTRQRPPSHPAARNREVWVNPPPVPLATAR